MGKEAYTVAQVILALKLSKGMVYIAAERLGCIPQTVYNYIARHPSIRTAWEAESGKMLDYGEMKLYEHVLKGDGWAVCFFLKTKGKGRGYVEKTELTIEEVGPRKALAALLGIQESQLPRSLPPSFVEGKAEA